MQLLESHTDITRRLVDSLYVEAMVLTDEARAYFDEFSRGDRSQLDPVMRVSFSCESLKVTTRLMHIIAWLLAYRASGEGGSDQISLPIDAPMRLGNPVSSEREVLDKLPIHARQIVETSIDLYARIRRVEADIVQPMPTSSPTHVLMGRLQRAF
jgi:regulator of CtrA degradation